MKTSALLARTALAVASLGCLGTAVAGEGLSKYYSLQNSAKYFSTASGNVGASLVVIRYKDTAGSSTTGTSSKSSSGASMVAPVSSSISTGNGYVSSKADSYESISGSSASTAAPLATYKTNTGTTASGWSGFTNSGNYSITTANGGVALNNVYVGGDLNITLNISGGTWNTSPHGGGNCGCVSHS